MPLLLGLRPKLPYQAQNVALAFARRDISSILSENKSSPTLSLFFMAEKANNAPSSATASLLNGPLEPKKLRAGSIAHIITLSSRSSLNFFTKRFRRCGQIRSIYFCAHHHRGYTGGLRQTLCLALKDTKVLPGKSFAYKFTGSISIRRTAF